MQLNYIKYIVVCRFKGKQRKQKESYERYHPEQLGTMAPL